MARTAAPFDEGNVIGHQRGKYWHIAYSTPSGRTRESLKKWNGGVNVTNKEQAKKLARQVNDMLEQGDYGGLKQMNNSQTITFRAFVENEFLRKGPWSERTKKGMGGCLVKLCGIFGDRPLQSLKPHDFITYLASRDDIAEATKNRYRASLKAVFKFAVKNQFAGHNPATAVTMSKEEIKPVEHLTREEFARLLPHLPEYLYQIAMVSGHSGLRRSELGRLKWKDIDFDKRQIVVGTSKNKTFRVVPMNDELYDFVLSMREAGPVPHPEKPVLWCRDHRKALGTALEKAKIKKKVTPYHTFRHSFATWCTEGGIHPLALKALGGWKSDAMLDRYSHMTNQTLHNEMKKMRVTVD